MIKLNGGIGKPYADEYKPRIESLFRATGAYASNGNVKDWGISSAYDTLGASPSADGDYIIIPVYCTGTETLLFLFYIKASIMGIFDLYINGVLDTAGIDAYASSYTDTMQKITLTQPIIAGWNEVKLVVNDKNASASNYAVGNYGVRLR